MTAPEVFRRITSALDQAGIAYMLSGSFASAYYGTPRSTQDIDIVVEATREQLRRFVQSLPKTEFYADLQTAIEASERESLFNIIDLATGWKIDLIIRKSRPFSREEFNRRKVIKLYDLLLYAATAEDIVISKLEWAKLGQSRRQIEDVTAILRVRHKYLDRPYLQKWIGELKLEQEWDAAWRSAALD
jgi:hypothetical protein